MYQLFKVLYLMYVGGSVADRNMGNGLPLIMGSPTSSGWPMNTKWQASRVSSSTLICIMRLCLCAFIISLVSSAAALVLVDAEGKQMGPSATQVKNTVTHMDLDAATAWSSIGSSTWYVGAVVGLGLAGLVGYALLRGVRTASAVGQARSGGGGGSGGGNAVGGINLGF